MTGLKTSIRFSGLADEMFKQTKDLWDYWRTVIRDSTFAGSETSSGTSGFFPLRSPILESIVLRTNDDQYGVIAARGGDC